LNIGYPKRLRFDHLASPVDQTFWDSIFYKMLLDLKYYEQKAGELLPNVGMTPFLITPSATCFSCPLLNWTLPIKTGTRVQGIVILQDWWNAPETLESAVHYVTKVTNGLYDATLTPLFGSRLWFDAFMDREEGWLATNAVWGLRPSSMSEVGYLGDNRHQAGFVIWAGIVKDLLKLNPKLKIVLAGTWAEFKKEHFKSELTGGPSYKAAEVFGWWRDWIARRTSPSQDSLSLAKDLESMHSEAVVEHWFAPAAWKTKYRGTPPPP